MRIRPAQTKDLGPLMGIAKRCIVYLDCQKINQWDEVYPAEKDFEDDIIKEDLFVMIPPHENVIRGCICINGLEYPGYENARWDGSEFAVVHKIMVDPLYEGLGFGRYAMIFAERIACCQKKDSIRLDCFQVNTRANNFYRGLGYVKKGQTLFRKGMFNLYEKLL